MINFRFTSKVLQNEVDEAILNLHIQELEPRHNVTLTDDHFTINLQVNRVTRNSQGNKASVPYAESSIKLTKKELKVGKWLKVNVTTMVAEFFRLPRENLAIVVRVQDSKNRMSLVVPHPSSEINNAVVSTKNVLNNVFINYSVHEDEKHQMKQLKKIEWKNCIINMSKCFKLFSKKSTKCFMS